MTPTPREDTMTEQTEQEQMDPWKDVRNHIDVMKEQLGDVKCARALNGGVVADDDTPMPHIRVFEDQIVWLEAAVDAARAADAAQVRERDAQIARLSAQVEQQQESASRLATALAGRTRELLAVTGAIAYDDGPHELTRLARLNRRADNDEDVSWLITAYYSRRVERDTLRAERDAAQQQIATLTEIALDALACWQGEDDTHNDDSHRRGRSARSRATLRARIAALQVTRP